MQMGFASCANLSQAADLLGETRRDVVEKPQRDWPKCVKCKLDKKSSLPRNKAKKREEWRRVAAQLLKDIREDIALAHHMTGGPRLEQEQEQEAAFRVHFQMKAATNFKVDYVCRSHLKRIPPPSSRSCPST